MIFRREFMELDHAALSQEVISFMNNDGEQLLNTVHEFWTNFFNSITNEVELTPEIQNMINNVYHFMQPILVEFSQTTLTGNSIEMLHNSNNDVPFGVDLFNDSSDESDYHSEYLHGFFTDSEDEFQDDTILGADGLPPIPAQVVANAFEEKNGWADITVASAG